jgi:E3 ubiquitin-protein ligase DOA10
MNDRIVSVFGRQLIFIVSSLGISTLLLFYFGIFVGFILSIIIFLALIFYIRSNEIKALKSFGFSNEKMQGLARKSKPVLRYACISCGREFTGSKCKKCGSKIKKPLF